MIFEIILIVKYVHIKSISIVLQTWYYKKNLIKIWKEDTYLQSNKIILYYSKSINILSILCCVFLSITYSVYMACAVCKFATKLHLCMKFQYPITWFMAYIKQILSKCTLDE